MSINQFALQSHLAALDNHPAITPELHAARENALEALPSMLDSLEGMNVDALFTAYFMCSYGHHPKKHELKKNINRLMRENLLHNGCRDYEGMKRKNDKPVCVVITNWFTETHVMNRVFGQSLGALKRDFHTVNICLHQTDFAAAQHFDKVIQASYGMGEYHEYIQRISKLITDQNPDVILFADIAMHPFGAMLSNLRLAPLQVTILGHPAPSHSPMIDAYIMEDSYAGMTDDFSERIVLYPKDDLSVRPPMAKPLKPRKSILNQPVRIIVPCSVHKITYPFLTWLREIQKETSAEFHITSNAVKGNELIAAQIEKTVPGVKYYPGMHYDDFIFLISQMDMFIMTYPFSGFSTVQDALTQAVPGVALRGNHPLEHQAVAMFERCNYFHIAPTPEMFIAQAVDMATNPILRANLTAHLYERFNSDKWKDLTIFNGKSKGIANKVLDLHRERA